MMKTWKILATVFGLFLSSPALATIIPPLTVDFRDAAWSGAYGQSSWNVGTVTATETGYGTQLYQDSVDGLGILDGRYERDEIEKDEQLTISFGSGMYLLGVWITDLFDSPDGGNGEHGIVTINSGAYSFTFDGNESDQGNGELFVKFDGGLWVTDAVFMADNSDPNTSKYKNEFSVAGFVASVPEPGPLALLSLGLMGIGLGKLRQRKRI